LFENREANMEIVISDALIGDLAEILALQKVCYYQEAEIINDFTIKPLLQTINEIGRDLQEQVILKAVLENRIIGSVRAFEKEGSCHIGRLIVRPDHQNQGLGKRLMNEIESLFKVKRYELFTGSMSVKNIFLYNKLGYREFKQEITNGEYHLVYLQKLTGGAL
jgi:ribosomal protein S18 acetylase RimI-like enzyme